MSTGMNQFLKKKIEASKPAQKESAFDDDKTDDKKKKKEGWSDEEEDDYKINIRVDEKKIKDTSKPAIVSLASGWKEEDLKINQPEVAGKGGKKWGDNIKNGVTIEKESFPTLGDVYEKGAEKDDGKKDDKQMRNPGLLTRNTTATQPTTGGAQEVDEGRVKFKNSKPVANSLLAAVHRPEDAKAQGQVSEPAQDSPQKDTDEGTGVIKFKGKLKVDYKETEIEKAQREAEKELRRKEEERKAQLEKDFPRKDFGTGTGASHVKKDEERPNKYGHSQGDSKPGFNQSDSKTGFRQGEGKPHTQGENKYGSSQGDSNGKPRFGQADSKPGFGHSDNKPGFGQADNKPTETKTGEQPKMLGRGGFPTAGPKKDGKVTDDGWIKT